MRQCSQTQSPEIDKLKFIMPIHDPSCGTLVTYEGHLGRVRAINIHAGRCTVQFFDGFPEQELRNALLEYTPVEPVTADNFFLRTNDDIGHILHRTKTAELIELYNELTGKNVRKVHDQIDILRRLYALRSEYARKQEGITNEDPGVIETLAMILKDSASFSASARDSKSRSAQVFFKIGLTHSTLYFDDEEQAVLFDDYVRLIDGVFDIVLTKRPLIVRNTSLNTQLGANALSKPVATRTASGNAARPPAGSSDKRIIKRTPAADTVAYKGKRAAALAECVDGISVVDWLAAVASLEKVDKSFLKFFESQGLIQIGEL